VLAGALLAALAVGGPGTAAAAAPPVDAFAGAPGPLRGAAPKGTELDRFFPRTITIAAGRSVRWRLRGFHSVTFVPKGTEAPPFVDIDGSRPMRGFTDQLGAPLWFNGLPTLFLGARALARTPGPAYDGSALRSSGLPPATGAVRPYTLRFPRAGSYRFVCLSHPGSRNVANGMRGVVRVLPRGRRPPPPSTLRRAVTRELASAARSATRLARHRGPSGARVVAGHDRDGITLLRFFPRVRSVRVGQTVSFEISPQSLSFHTVTFGPQAETQPHRRSFVPFPSEPGSPARLAVDPVTFFGTEPIKLFRDDVRDPAGPAPDYDGRNHGSGFLSLIALDIDDTPASPNPRRALLRFTRAGAYRYVCLVHPGMDGRIVVRG